MNKIILIGLFFTLWLFSTPAKSQNLDAVMAQTEEAEFNANDSQAVENAQTETVDNKEKKDKKKKDKELIEINSKFYKNLIINLLSAIVLLGLIYYPGNKNMEHIFTLLSFNIVIFLLTFVLNQVKISMGAAFGLFAIFSMLRYRTEGISMKDMTYLFIFIALGLLGAIQLEIKEQITINSIIIVSTFLLDAKWLHKTEKFKHIEYENIELVQVDNPALIEDLKKRTGINIHRFEIKRIDYLKDSATLVVYYYE